MSRPPPQPKPKLGFFASNDAEEVEVDADGDAPMDDAGEGTDASHLPSASASASAASTSGNATSGNPDSGNSATDRSTRAIDPGALLDDLRADGSTLARLASDPSSALPVSRFLNLAYSSLDAGLKDRAMRLCTVATWHFVTPRLRDLKNPKAWSRQLRRPEKATATENPARSVLPSLLAHVPALVSANDGPALSALYALFVTLESQLPTRRFFHTLLLDSLALCYPPDADASSEAAAMFAELLNVVRNPVNEQTGVHLAPPESRKIAYAKLEAVRLVAFAKHKGSEGLQELALKDISALLDPETFRAELGKVPADELRLFANDLGVRTERDGEAVDKGVVVQAIVEQWGYFPSPSPRGGVLIDQRTLLSLDSLPPTLPRLLPSHLSLPSYSSTLHTLHTLHLSTLLSHHLDSVLSHLAPRFEERGTEWGGWSRHARLLDSFAVSSVSSDFADADLSFQLGGLSEPLRKEWDRLSPRDRGVLVRIEPPPDEASAESQSPDLARWGVRQLRCCTVLSIADEEGRTPPARGSVRRMRVRFDRRGYENAKNTLGGVNLFVRTGGLGEIGMFEGGVGGWIEGGLLGYGNPRSAGPDAVEGAVRALDVSGVVSPDLAAEVLGLEMRGEGQGAVVVLPVSRFTEGSEAVFAPVAGKLVDAEGMEDGAVVRHPTRKELEGARVPIAWTGSQLDALISGARPGLTLISGAPGTGKSQVSAGILQLVRQNWTSDRILVIVPDAAAGDRFFDRLVERGTDAGRLLRLTRDGSGFGRDGRLALLFSQRASLLRRLDLLARSLGIPGDWNSCESGGYFWAAYGLAVWEPYRAKLGPLSRAKVEAEFPFSVFFNAIGKKVFDDGMGIDEAKEAALAAGRWLSKMFAELAALRPLELLKSDDKRAQFLLQSHAHIVAVVASEAHIARNEMLAAGFNYSTALLLDATRLTEPESVLPMLIQPSIEGSGGSRLVRIVMVADPLEKPVVKNPVLARECGMERSLFSRLEGLGAPVIKLGKSAARKEIVELVAPLYPELEGLESNAGPNAGMAHEVQFIEVAEYHGKGESEPLPGVFQNLGEAEFVVAVYQYLRLVGWPADKIGVVAATSGELINDILSQRCPAPLFGPPAFVLSFAQRVPSSDILLVSLVRTKHADLDLAKFRKAIRGSTKGLYVFGRQRAHSGDAAALLKGLAKSAAKLCLFTAERYPIVDASARGKPMVVDGVDQMQALAYDMTLAKREELKNPKPVEEQFELPAVVPRAPAPRPEEEVEEDEEVPPPPPPPPAKKGKKGKKVIEEREPEPEPVQEVEVEPKSSRAEPEPEPEKEEPAQVAEPEAEREAPPAAVDEPEPQPPSAPEKEEEFEMVIEQVKPASKKRGKKAAAEHESEDEHEAERGHGKKRKAAAEPESEAEVAAEAEESKSKKRRAESTEAAESPSAKLGKDEETELLALHPAKLKVADLREWLEKLGLPTDGLKAVLVERLEEEIARRKA